MNALEALGDDCADAEQHRALGRPVARTSRAIFLAREDDEWRSVMQPVVSNVGTIIRTESRSRAINCLLQFRTVLPVSPH